MPYVNFYPCSVSCYNTYILFSYMYDACLPANKCNKLSTLENIKMQQENEL